VSGALTVGVILAGGLGRRMGGGDKPLMAVGDRPMLDRVVERLAPQVDRVIINANGDPARFARYRLPVVPDTIAGFAGPLAGILAGMRWTQKNLPSAQFIVSAAGDTPFFPTDLAERLAALGNGETIALGASEAGAHPVFGRWPVALADDLEAFLTTGKTGKILSFVDRYERAEAFFDPIRLPSGEKIEPFFNVNTPADAAEASRIATALQDMPA
jgi:molybdopterin-guanine dinucleotide biosynthesis protein A